MEETGLKPGHWHVLGAGAIGCLFASLLKQSGCPVTLVPRSNTEEVSWRLRVDSDKGSFEEDFPLSDPGATDPIDLLLVTTKAHQVQPAVQTLAHRLTSASQVLLLSNGLGYAERLREQLPDPDYYVGITYNGAYHVSEDPASAAGPALTQTCNRHIHHAGLGLTLFGGTGDDTPPDWFQDWRNGVRPTIWHADIDRALWQKWAVNCVINPLTALHHCRNGGLSEGDLPSEVTRLCEEVAAVTTAAGFEMSSERLRQETTKIIWVTRENQSSMLQDVLAGRETEIEYITGHLLRLARERGLATPISDELYAAISGHAF